MKSEAEFRVRLTPQAERVYRHLDRAVRTRVDRMLQQFEAGNFTSNNIIALRGSLSGSLRYRLGDWRIVFSIHRAEGIVWIEAISTRGGAYR